MAQIIDVLSEFIEAFIHQTLAVRKLYPSGVFEHQRKYGTAVQVCLHPTVRQYVCELVRSLRPHLTSLRQLDVVVTSEGQREPLEKIVLRIDHLSETILDNDPYLSRSEDHFRGMLLRLSLCSEVLKESPDDTTWFVLAHSEGDHTLNLDENFAWVVNDNENRVLEDCQVVPLKTMNTEFMRMQLYVEERQS